MQEIAVLDLNAVKRTDPFDPELLVEYTLQKLGEDVAAARTRSGEAFTAGGAVLRQLYADFKAAKDADAACDLAEEEAFQQLKLLVQPDFLVDEQAVSQRVKELIDGSERLKEWARQLLEYHLSQRHRYNELGECLRKYIAILPGVTHEVRRAKILSSILRAIVLGLALGGTVLLEMALAHTAEELFKVLFPSYAKVIVVVLLYLLGLAFFEKPLDRWLGEIHWRLFERIRKTRARDLTHIQEIESSLAALVAASP